MADEAPNTSRPFNIRTIRELVGLMSKHDLSEIDLSEGEMRIQLRRGGREVTPASMLSPVVIPQPPPAAVASAAETAPAAEAAKPAKPLHAIKSPTPGTFYSSPSPDAQPFVKVGSRVTPTTPVCLIEAMKIFTQIEAECSGVITEILVENQQPVEYGQVLFSVDPTG